MGAIPLALATGADPQEKWKKGGGLNNLITRRTKDTKKHVLIRKAKANGRRIALGTVLPIASTTNNAVKTEQTGSPASKNQLINERGTDRTFSRR